MFYIAFFIISIFLIISGTYLIDDKNIKDGVLFILIGIFFLIILPRLYVEPCELIKADIAQQQYEDYTEYVTYLYFEDEDGNIFKRKAEDMNGKNYIIGETYQINTWN